VEGLLHHDAHFESTQKKNGKLHDTESPHQCVHSQQHSSAVWWWYTIADDECTMGLYCFFQTGYLNYTQMDTRVVMEGNRAGKAGDSMHLQEVTKRAYLNTFQQGVLLCY